MMKKLIIGLATILVALTVWAQSPQKMSYQAVIRNSSDHLITNQIIGMQVSILQGSISGTAVYVETHTPTTNTNGLVTVEIGGGTIVNGTFDSIDWSNGPYFIKTETDTAGGSNYTITGTSQLLSVPYALHAKNTDNWVSIDEYNTKTYKSVKIYNDSLSLILKANSGVDRLILSPDGIWDSRIGSMANLIFIADIDGNQTLRNNFIWMQDGYSLSSANEVMRLNDTGRLIIKQNDVYIENIGSGVIMKSPNGDCWRVTVDNSGNFVSTSITCP